MIEMNGANTGLLVTEGHRDEIELRRCHKESIWDPNAPGPIPIARRRARIPIRERMDHTGKVVHALDEQAVRRGVQRLKALGVTSIAVMYLFSFVNPEHERRTREIILEEFPDVEHISLSHEVMPRGPEFERVSTTLVNAYVAPRIAHYTSHLQDELRRAGYGGPLLIMQSTGGVMPPDYVARRAVTLLASGPTGGVMGATLAAEPRRRRRLPRRRHGRHQLRHLPRAPRPTADQDRLELALPLLHRAPDGRRAERRRGRRFDRARAPGRAARRPGIGRLGPGPGVLQPRRRAAHRDRRRRRARLPPRRRFRGRPHAPRRRRRRSRDPQPRRRAARPRRDRSRVGHRAHREREHGQRVAQGAREPRRRRPRPLAHRLRRQRRGARVRDRPGARRQAGSTCRRPRPRSPRSACSSPTTWSTSCAPT